MIKQKEMPTTGLVCDEMLGTGGASFVRGAHHIKENITNVTLHKEGNEVCKDEETERNGSSGW